MNLATLAAEGAKLGIELEGPELLEIVESLHPPLNFLVFGVGNDSVFWQGLNPGGRTVFIEDNPEWFAKVKESLPAIEAYLIQYPTKRYEWWGLLSHPEKLFLKLPPEIQGVAWDAILVDAPNGHIDTAPGRMCSIYTAAQIVKPGGDIFVHDCTRKVEKMYSNIFLRKANLVAEVRGRDLLRHYRMNHPSRSHAPLVVRYGELALSF